MLKILRYSDAIQKLIGSKVKPEPWMHIALYFRSESTYGENDTKDPKMVVYWAIYIWDTREVLDSRAITNCDWSKWQALCNKSKRAIDNHVPLADNSYAVKTINNFAFQKA